MLYELRTYTVKAGTVPAVLGLFEQALPHRVERSPLGGFWYTEIGPLNQVVHLWPYDSVAHRAEVRASFADDPAWPPPIHEHVIDMRSDVIVPFASVGPLGRGALGPVYELRRYTVVPGTMAELTAAWEPMLEARSRLSKPLLVGTTEFGELNHLIHIWPYKSLEERSAIRARAVETGVWPPPTAPLLTSMSSTILLPASFSPLQ